MPDSRERWSESHTAGTSTNIVYMTLKKMHRKLYLYIFFSHPSRSPSRFLSQSFYVRIISSKLFMSIMSLLEADKVSLLFAPLVWRLKGGDKVAQ